MRLLLSQTSHANCLLNTQGQTPLLCSIESGSTSTAILLMEHDPVSLTCNDNINSNVFHYYATEQCNFIVSCRAVALLKRLISSATRVRIPSDERELYRPYKYFLKHYNVAYSGSSYDQTPIQRMLTMFIGENVIDLSIIGDCLRARPAGNRSLIAEANCAPVYDHDVVKICVDLKFQLFGNFLYLLILYSQILFVALYTGITLASPTLPQSYYDTSN
ncbi:unnamed protein product [Rotaria magnacalcarata]|uniref:Uncharacterized protein n=1 Tax=Rotaria magnacalcarata TaxID=392030 RepID=A0A816Q8V5_9BILA|nr:unnamed protein product [Rotaria magnacalcarata]